MLKNEYLDAKIGVDKEENEPPKVLYFHLIFIPPRDLIFTYVYRPSASKRLDVCVQDDSDEALLKLIDFGFAKHVR